MNIYNFFCLICYKEFKKPHGLGSHVVYVHKLTKQEYYDKFYKKEGEGICVICSKETKFLTCLKGYSSCCSGKCSSIWGWKKLRQNSEKYNKSKVNYSRASIKRWANNEYKSYTRDKMSEGIERVNNSLTEDELRRKYSNSGFPTVGLFKVKNSKKYIGNTDLIIYRSNPELSLMINFDDDPHVLNWSSEEIIVPYYFIDGRKHRYFVDFYCERINSNGEIRKLLIEYKPFSQTQPPKKRKSRKISCRRIDIY